METRRAEPARIAGLSARTNNAAEAQPSAARIPPLWSRFTSEEWFDRLGKVGAVGPPVAVYTDYTSDVSGDYRILIGRQVPIGASLPPGLESLSTPGGRYLVFPFKGPLPQVVIEGWKQVWTFFERPQPFARAYTADWELYHPGGAGVEIWIAVREPMMTA